MPGIGPDTAARLGARAADRRRPQLMHQRWESLLFLHWRVAPERIQQTLPRGLSVDTFNGDAYVAIVPFLMRNVRPIGVPAMPWISHFLELNVRTYAYDAHGVPGVWFYALECNQPVAVQVARTTTGLRYLHAAMSATRADWVQYASRRYGVTETARFRYRGIDESEEAVPGSLEFFLLERYYLFAKRGASLVRAQVAHPPYRFRAAEVPELSHIPAQLEGFLELTGPPVHTCMSEGVDVKIYGTKKIGDGSAGVSVD